IVPVHALTTVERHSSPDLDEARERAHAALDGLFAPAVEGGVPVAAPVTEPEDAATLVARTAAQVGSPMIVTGGGQRGTLRHWLMGSTADRIVRTAHRPVWVDRGTSPMQHGPIVVPVDLGPAARIGLSMGLRMARLFGNSVRLVHVVSQSHSPLYGRTTLDTSADGLERRRVAIESELLAAHDTEGVDVETVVVAGTPAAQILDNAHDADLIVLASPTFEWVLPGTVGGVAEKVLRRAGCSVLTVWDDDPARDMREKTLRGVSAMVSEARRVMQDEPERAERLVRAALQEIPLNAALHESLADALAIQGKDVEADKERAMARDIRDSIG
ncbi:MAG: universal stress protein, partial [Polyangiales bacterium]